jgi:cyclopropane-fatty-acyl-phospholipid synthase
MSLTSIEHGRVAYWADFGIYAVALAGSTLTVVVISPADRLPMLAALVGTGLAAWTLIEYGVHRFVLHGMEPFRAWHARHHARPAAYVSTPTPVSAGLIALLVFLPAELLGGWLPASALTLGVTAGYFAYALTHHAIHHWPARSAWMARRKRWHALHHRTRARYGVTGEFWDRVFRSAGDGDA